MYVRITPEQIRGIFATGSAACARSLTVEAPPDAIAAKLGDVLSKATRSTKIHRAPDGATLVDTGGALVREEWLAQLMTFGPKTTVNLRAARVVRVWMILVGWLVLPSVVGAVVTAATIAATRRPSGGMLGVAFVAGVIVCVLVLQAIGKATAASFARDAHGKLGVVEKELAEAFAAKGTYRG